ncbi:MAG: putative endonuclease [Patescibacteria group bacterium]|nr:putative endonuclease [Patescibacteria group bacterium]
MPKVFTSETQKTGEIGENIAVKFLMKQGFEVIERNYTKKWGEIDIITQKDSKIHFIEVKSVSSKDSVWKREATGDNYRAEDNMHPWKLKRLSRTIQTYLLSHKEYEEKEWQVDLIVVYLDLENKKARVKLESDIIL